jgi:hypothetical protein
MAQTEFLDIVGIYTLLITLPRSPNLLPSKNRIAADKPHGGEFATGRYQLFILKEQAVWRS